MAWKKLGAADLSATTNTSLYTVGTGKEAICAVNICNRTASAIAVRLALAEGGTPGDEDYLVYDYELAANNQMQVTGIHMDAAKVLVGYAGAADTSFVVWGNERTA